MNLNKFSMSAKMLTEKKENFHKEMEENRQEGFPFPSLLENYSSLHAPDKLKFQESSTGAGRVSLECKYH